METLAIVLAFWIYWFGVRRFVVNRLFGERNAEREANREWLETHGTEKQTQLPTIPEPDEDDCGDDPEDALLGE